MKVTKTKYIDSGNIINGKDYTILNDKDYTLMILETQFLLKIC